MTPQPQINADPEQPEQNRSENIADNVGSTDTPGERAPIDKSSPEWRSQFGVLPSAPRFQGAPLQTRGAAAKKPEKKSPASFLFATLAVIGVGGIIAYGYMPSRQKTETKREKPELGKTFVAVSSGSTVKKLRDTVKKAQSPATTPAAKPTPEAVRPSAPPAKPAVAKAKPAAHQAAETAPRPVQTPGPQKRPATPPPQRAAPKPPVNRATPAPAPVVAQVAPHPEKTPKPEPVGTVAKPKSKPTLHPLPEIPPPHQEGIEPDGTNPLDIPR